MVARQMKSEAICRYMLEEKQLNTFVKLNPAALGTAYLKFSTPAALTISV